jgi:pSer/pThr/pTyr-binding forkhead associated (FHA) protein
MEKHFMLDSNSFGAQSIGAFSTLDDTEINQRLGLYQVFLRVYEQNRGLLDELLNLETAGVQPQVRGMLPFVQGMVRDQQICLVTNLVGGNTQALEQPQNIWTIGRDSQRVVIPLGDRRLSRVHAAIQYTKGEGFYLIDLGSSNGSYVNGEPVRRQALLKDGDRVRLGSFTFTFLLCESRRSLGGLSAEMLTRVGHGDSLPTQPLSSLPSHNSEATTSHSPEEADALKAALEETSSYPFLRIPPGDRPN